MKQQTEQVIPADIFNRLQMALLEMQTALVKADPEMPKHLQESHRLIITYPESVHLLDDEEINGLVRAAETLTKVQIVKETAAKTGPGRKKAIGQSDI